MPVDGEYIYYRNNEIKNRKNKKQSRNRIAKISRKKNRKKK